MNLPSQSVGQEGHYCHGAPQEWDALPVTMYLRIPVTDLYYNCIIIVLWKPTEKLTSDGLETTGIWFMNAKPLFDFFHWTL